MLGKSKSANSERMNQYNEGVKRAQAKHGFSDRVLGNPIHISMNGQNESDLTFPFD